MILASDILTVERACFNNNFDINSIDVWTLERLLFYIFSENIEIS